MSKVSKERTRNYGIDLLRLVSMFFVVLLHALLASGALSGAGNIYNAAWFLEVFAFGAVNIFGIISGYVGFREEKRSFKWKSFFSIWGQGIFYSAGVLAVVVLLGASNITKSDVITLLTPVFHNIYWYLTAYLLLMLMMPMLNAWVRELSKKQCARLVWVMLVLATLLSVKELVPVSGGYSAIWLAVLYLIGAFMKKGEFLQALKKRWCALGIVILALIVWAVKIWGGDISGIPSVILRPFYVSYVSPLILFSAILYVKMFSGISFKNRFVIKMIEWAAPCAFGVFLLNTHPLILWSYMPSWLSPVANMGQIGGLLFVLLFAAVFFIVAITIDKIRHSGFLLIKKMFKR